MRLNILHSVIKIPLKKTVACALTVGVFLLCPSTSFAAGAGSSKTVLENGMTVLIREMPASPVVSVYALVKTGSATEGKYLGTGISHFLEHMLFKGTKERGVGDIAAQVQAVGGRINASTGMDYTMYTITVPFESFGTALEVLADMLMHSVMDPAEVEKEREVIFGEMRMHNDNPDRKLSELAFQTMYIKHPYRHPIIGYRELLAGATREDLMDYYRLHYAPNNMVLSVAGNIHAGEIMPKIKEAFKAFERQRDVLRNLPTEPRQISQRRYDQEYPTDLARLLMGFSGTSLLHQDLYALDVLAMILGQGESSRLYLNVYKREGLVHHIFSSNYTPIDRGFFEVEALLDKENVQSAVEAVINEIEVVKKKGVKKNELEKAKRRVLSEHIFSHQKASRVAYSQAIDEAYAGDYRFSEKYVEGIRKITNEDIKRAARQYLTDEALTVVVLKPQAEGEVLAEEEKGLPSGQIQKHQFDNGLTLLLREDHELPIVSIRLSLQGGLRQEDPALNGISQMTSSIWIKGTKSLSSRQIAEQTESLGMDLSSFSGRNSFGVSIDCLAEDLKKALGLLEDTVKNPVFSDEGLRKVKDLMKAAVRGREDDIFDYTSLALKGLLFENHPLRLDEGGTIETIEDIRREDVVGFYQHLAAPSNMVVSVFGDINPTEVLEIIQKRFGSLPAKAVKLKTFYEHPPEQLREKDLFLDKEQALVMFGFHGVELTHKDRYGLEVLTSILGSSFSGRLFNSVREQLGQAYALGGNFVSTVDAGFVYFYVLTSRENVPRVKMILRREIERIQKEDVPNKELEDAKRYMKGNFKASLETNSALSFTSALDELYGLGFKFYQDYDRNIDAVRSPDIKRLAAEYLDLNKAAVVVTYPRKD